MPIETWHHLIKHDWRYRLIESTAVYFVIVFPYRIELRFSTEHRFINTRPEYAHTRKLCTTAQHMSSIHAKIYCDLIFRRYCHETDVSSLILILKKLVVKMTSSVSPCFFISLSNATITATHLKRKKILWIKQTARW